MTGDNWCMRYTSAVCASSSRSLNGRREVPQPPTYRRHRRPRMMNSHIRTCTSSSTMLPAQLPGTTGSANKDILTICAKQARRGRLCGCPQTLVISRTCRVVPRPIRSLWTFQRRRARARCPPEPGELLIEQGHLSELDDYRQCTSNVTATEV